MKKAMIVCAASALLTFALQARDLPSPDGKYAIRAEAEVSLVDASGQVLLVLARETSSVQKVEVLWSPDSRKVALVEGYLRGSVVIGAWVDQAVWRKTIQVDQDQVPIVRRAEKTVGGRLTKEERSFNGWASMSAINVKGTMVLGGSRICHYGYVLEFKTNEPGKLDRGGFEEGVIVGKDYKFL